MDQARKQPRLTLIEGRKTDLERKKHLLFCQPWAFDLGEFDRLCRILDLSRDEIFDLAVARLRHLANTSYEAAAALAIFEGGNPSEILARGRRASFKVESASPSTPPR